MNCTLNWSFTSQSEGTFAGRMSSDGQSPDSDFRCSYSGQVSGLLQPDGSLSLRFDPPWRPSGCSNGEGSDTMTGRMTGNDTFSVTSSGSATCRMLRGSTDPAHIRDVNYTMTASGRRR